MPPFDTTTSVKDLMANVIDPTADEVWESVGTIMTKEGTFEKVAGRLTKSGIRQRQSDRDP